MENRNNNRIPLQFTAQVTSAGFGGAVTLQNLSAGGCMFVCDQRIAAGAQINIRINFTGLDQPIDATGRVVRSMPRGIGFETGVQFTEIKERDRNAIDKAAQKWL